MRIRRTKDSQLKIVETDNGPEYQFIGNFENVSDAKSFINQAGGI